MGKIRIKTFGEEKAPKQKKVKPKKEDVKIPGLKGGEKVKTIGVSAEDLEKQPSTQPDLKTEADEEKSTEKKKKQKFVKVKVKSKRYQSNLKTVDSGKLYKLSEALKLLKDFKKTGFDETVELHVNVKEKGISGQMTLPHGSGKKIRIKIADDQILDAVSKGKIDFDILIAEPAMMSKLAKVAKILGPKGLMPNPKAGTITTEPQKLIEKLSKGQINFKTESEAPVIHLSVGKLSFEEKQLEENILEAYKAVGEAKINNVTLKSTMSPAIKLALNA